MCLDMGVKTGITEKITESHHVGVSRGFRVWVRIMLKTHLPVSRTRVSTEPSKQKRTCLDQRRR